MRHLNYKHLLYFWTVAREGSLAAAARTLHLTPQTVSGQLKSLEEAIGEPLFERGGRPLALSATGELVYRYADAMFVIGSELSEQVREQRPRQPPRLRIGARDSVPESITCRVLETALALPEPPRLHISEGDFEDLLKDLTSFRLDLLLADEPPPEHGVLRAHLLAESGTSFFAAEDPGEELRRGFPGSLHGRAMALPDRSIALRRQLDAWFHEQRISPRITAEVDDSGLLAAFGNAGAGVFPAPAVLERSIVEAWNVRPIGRADTVRESFYAITRERQVELPAIREIVETTRSDLFAGPPRARPTPARRSA